MGDVAGNFMLKGDTACNLQQMMCMADNTLAHLGNIIITPRATFLVAPRTWVAMYYILHSVFFLELVTLNNLPMKIVVCI